MGEAEPNSRAEPNEIVLLRDAAEVSERAAQLFADAAQRAISRNGVFTAALSGGSTPKHTYELLGSSSREYRTQIDWNRVHLFWGDERHVPPDSSESNYRMVRDAMLGEGGVPIPMENVHRIHTELPDAQKAALEYEKEIRGLFAKSGRGSDGFPRFDLMLLGMGPDAHTASLFPGTEALHETQKAVVANWVEKLNTWRITVTRPVIDISSLVVVMIAGAEKADAVAAVFSAGAPDESLPISFVRRRTAPTVWLLDEAAAAKLPRRKPSG